MCNKLHKKHVCLMLTKSIALFLIVTLNLYPPATHLYHKENSSQLLRPASYQNGNGSSPDIFSFTIKPTPILNSRGESVPGAKTEVITTEGVVEVEAAEEITLVGAGDRLELKPGAPLILRTSSAGELESFPAEFRGTPLDVVEGQFKTFNLVMQRQVGKLPELKNKKFIEFNVDLLPDFDLRIDSAQKKLAEAILEAVANRILQYKRDRRFERADRRIYIDFVSRKGDLVKKDKIKGLFEKDLQIVRDHRLYELLQSAPADTAVSDKIIITYEGDPLRPEYPALILKTEVISDEKIMAYPWHTVIDLSVGILTIDRMAKNIHEEEAYAAIKELFKYLLKEKVDITDELLSKFLSNEPKVAINAAYQLALPPVQVVDLDSVEDINRMTIEAAKWA